MGEDPLASAQLRHSSRFPTAAPTEAGATPHKTAHRYSPSGSLKAYEKEQMPQMTQMAAHTFWPSGSRHCAISDTLSPPRIRTNV
jgi:hypothetical protein